MFRIYDQGHNRLIFLCSLTYPSYQLRRCYYELYPVNPTFKLSSKEFLYYTLALRINVRSTDELNKIWSRLIHALLYAQCVSNESGTILHARKKPPPIFVLNI